MIYVTEDPLDPGIIFSRPTDPAVGALVTFFGVVRNHHDGQVVANLFYESYRPMAEKQIHLLVAEARRQWDLRDVYVRHRVGRLVPGETAVAIAVWSDHRAEAFEAARFLIDEIKHTVPIWKHETYENGVSTWVRCHELATR